MGNIKIIGGVFDTKLEQEYAGVAAGFPSPANENYPVFKVDNPDEFEVWGVVIHQIRTFGKL